MSEEALGIILGACLEGDEARTVVTLHYSDGVVIAGSATGADPQALQDAVDAVRTGACRQGSPVPPAEDCLRAAERSMAARGTPEAFVALGAWHGALG